LLGALVAGGATFYAAFVALIENLPDGARLPLYVPVMIAIAGAGAFLALGARVLRSRGIAFLASEKPTPR
jgi:hypothetical protein